MKSQIKEWVPEKRWNPFNSHKLLTHVERWRYIQRGKPIPAPILVTIDPVNACDLDCLWCNAKLVRQKRSGRMISEKTLIRIANFLPHWGANNPVCVPAPGTSSTGAPSAKYSPPGRQTFPVKEKISRN